MRTDSVLLVVLGCIHANCPFSCYTCLLISDVLTLKPYHKDYFELTLYMQRRIS